MFMVLSIPLSAIGRFSLVIEGLCQAVAARIAAPNFSDVLIRLIWSRLRRIQARVRTLAEQIRTGTLPPDPIARRRSAPDRSEPREPRPSPGLPRGFGWLLRLVPQHAAGYASQLRHLLADPEMAALVATPRIARTLRPLLHMLGLEPGLLPPRPPPAPKPVAPPPPPPPRELWWPFDPDPPLPDTG